MERPRPSPAPSLQRPAITLVFFIGLFFVLYIARDLFYPIALGALLAFLLVPVTARLEGWGCARAVANLIAIIVGIGMVYGMLWFIQHQLASLMSLPELKQKITTNLGGLLEKGARTLGIHMDEARKQAIMDRIGSAGNGEQLKKILSATSNTVLAIGLLPVYTFMFLYYRDKFREFLLMGAPPARRAMSERIIEDVSKVTTHYIAGVGAVVLILAVINSVGFMIIGIERPVLFALIAAICGSIPYFGNIAGYLLVIAATLITGSPDLAGYIALQFLVVQFIENNVLTPNIVGDAVRLSPFFIIVGLLGGTLLWGLPGALVVVPVLAMLKVTFDHLSAYAHWGFLLSDRKTATEERKPSKLNTFFTALLSKKTARRSKKAKPQRSASSA